MKLFAKVLLVVLVTVFSTQAIAGEASVWDHYRGNIHRTGFSRDGKGPARLNKMWTYTTRNMVQASPVVIYNKFGRSAFFASLDGYLYCVDPNCGNFRWKFKAGGPLESSPAVANDMVYFGCNDGYLYCLNMNNGELLWQYRAYSAIVSSPLVDPETNCVYFATTAGFLVSVDAHGNTIENWARYVYSKINSSPTKFGGTIIIGSDDGNLRKFDAGTGALLGIVYLGGRIVSTAAAGGNYLYVGSTNGHVYRINGQNMTVDWQYPPADKAALGAVTASPAIVYDNVYVGSWNNFFYCLDQNTGTLNWRYPTGGQIRSSAAVVDNKVYFGCNDGKVYCLDATSGTRIAQYKTSGSVFSSPVISNCDVFVGSNDKKLYRFYQDR